MEVQVNNLFTATQIARAAAITRQAVHAGLQTIAPAGILNSPGGEVVGWRFADLPMDWQLEITRRGVKRGFENGEQFLANLPEPWKCPLAWDLVPKHQQDKAGDLQDALARALAMRAAGLKGAELERVGMDDYKSVFGYPIKNPRHWRRLLHRTIKRDAGEENWQNPLIYWMIGRLRCQNQGERFCRGKTITRPLVLSYHPLLFRISSILRRRIVNSFGVRSASTSRT
jgi:hypothetical protein